MEGAARFIVPELLFMLFEVRTAGLDGALAILFLGAVGDEADRDAVFFRGGALLFILYSVIGSHFSVSLSAHDPPTSSSGGVTEKRGRVSFKWGLGVIKWPLSALPLMQHSARRAITVITEITTFTVLSVLRPTSSTAV